MAEINYQIKISIEVDTSWLALKELTSELKRQIKEKPPTEGQQPPQQESEQ